MEPLTEKDERMWAMFSHLAALGIFVFPLGNVIGPLVVWLIYREQSELIDANGRAAINFQIVMSIAMIVAGASFFCFIGIALLPAVLVFDVIYAIFAGVAANEGAVYAHPSWATYEFIK